MRSLGLIFSAAFYASASATAQPVPPGGVVTPPAMPQERKMVKPAPYVGDGEILALPPLAAESQDEFLDRMIALLEAESSAIKDLRQEISTLPPAARRLAMPSLRTASGNRVAALSKLQGLAAANALSWQKHRPAVDEAFQELRAAIERTRSALAH